jgi:hypothetical protein
VKSSTLERQIEDYPLAGVFCGLVAAVLLPERQKDEAGPEPEAIRKLRAAKESGSMLSALAVRPEFANSGIYGVSCT